MLQDHVNGLRDGNHCFEESSAARGPTVLAVMVRSPFHSVSTKHSRNIRICTEGMTTTYVGVWKFSRRGLARRRRANRSRKQVCKNTIRRSLSKIDEVGGACYALTGSKEGIENIEPWARTPEDVGWGNERMCGGSFEGCVQGEKRGGKCDVRKFILVL